MKDEYYKIMDIIFKKYHDFLSYEDCYDIVKDIDEKVFSNRLEKLVMPKIAEDEVLVPIKKTTKKILDCYENMSYDEVINWWYREVFDARMSTISDSDFGR